MSTLVHYVLLWILILTNNEPNSDIRNRRGLLSSKVPYTDHISIVKTNSNGIIKPDEFNCTLPLIYSGGGCAAGEVAMGPIGFATKPQPNTLSFTESHVHPSSHEMTFPADVSDSTRINFDGSSG